MTDALSERRRSAKDAGEAFAFFLLIGILIGLGYHVYCVIKANSTLPFPFMREFAEAALVGWSADWLVFVFVMVHAVRLVFGVLFLMHDDTLLATFDPENRFHRALKAILFVIAIALFLSLVVLVFTMQTKSLRGVLLLQGAILFFVDVVYSWWFLKDKDWRWNILIYIADAAFFLFLYLEHRFLNDRGPALLDWFGLAVYSVLILHILILLLEVPFTYGNSIMNAARNFGKVVWGHACGFWVAARAFSWPGGR